MPRKERKKTKTENEHFETIEILLGSILLDRKPTLAEVAKLVGVRKDKFIGEPRNHKGQENTS
jgi:hypothetical protein